MSVVVEIQIKSIAYERADIHLALPTTISPSIATTTYITEVFTHLCRVSYHLSVVWKR